MSEKPRPSKAARIAEFYKRLGAAPPCSTLDEAFELVCSTLNNVENELTDIPYNQETSDTDGRLYPPLRENLRDVKGQPRVRRHRHRFHLTFFGDNGSIEIRTVQTGQVEFQKLGRDGQGVSQL
ncbi:MAG TPA: hypothetical protein VND64_36630 [Pirellulales bacterium]|nr:hypothetical protein [Pirellulales bacterium]